MAGAADVSRWDATSVIMLKRDKHELPDEAIKWFIANYTEGVVADEQAAALCMAVFLNGLSAAELHTWTKAMIDTGDRTDLSSIIKPTVDKHSTGGVGDKVSLILVPLIIACGGAVPQLGGRGLGHTGGTIDKLQSHPGFDPFLSPEQLIEQCNTVGGVIAAAGARIAPADAKLYQLRDTTGTVASIPLIASSIMSKKIAGGTQNLVLDVKVGAGAFMTNIEDATLLAETMVRIGNDAGVNTSAFLTQMDVPLSHDRQHIGGGRVHRSHGGRWPTGSHRYHGRTGRRDVPVGRHRSQPGRDPGVGFNRGYLQRDGARPGW